MMAKYDGWCLKKIKARVPHLLLHCFAPLRRDVINLIELRIHGEYETWRNSEAGKKYRIVKVKLVEVK